MSLSERIVQRISERYYPDSKEDILKEVFENIQREFVDFEFSEKDGAYFTLTDVMGHTHLASDQISFTFDERGCTISRGRYSNYILDNNVFEQELERILGEYL